MDRIGMVYGRLSVIGLWGRNKHNQLVWNCQCSCGNRIQVTSNKLSRGVTRSCGCLRRELASRIKIDRTGQVYGRLTVVGEYGRKKGGGVIWECRCSCGNTVHISSEHLCHGHTQSCGCLKIDILKNRRRYNFREDVFDDIDIPDKAYWIGFILADGNISSDKKILSIQLQSGDADHILKFRSFIGTDAPINKIEGLDYRSNKIHNAINIKVCSKGLCSRLREIGIFPNKSLRTVSVHLGIPDEFLGDYWRGVVDGDGSIGFYKSDDCPRISLYGDIDVVRSFKEFCGGFVDAEKIKINTNRNIFSVEFTGRKAVIIARHLYSDASIYLERKYELAKRFLCLPRYVDTMRLEG